MSWGSDAYDKKWGPTGDWRPAMERSKQEKREERQERDRQERTKGN